jgi:hypothetical protein
MTLPLNIAMPQDLDLVARWTLQVAALDSTGAPVANVNVGPISITADNIVGGNLSYGPFLLVPGPAA